jgi:hypothetical protein
LSNAKSRAKNFGDDRIGYYGSPVDASYVARLAGRCRIANYGVDEMRVTITTPPGIFAEGVLKGIISEQDGHYPHMVIEMSVAGVSNRVEVTLDEVDLSTIVQRGSTVQRIRDAVR